MNNRPVSATRRGSLHSVRVISFTAVITALALAVLAFGRIPAVLFLKYDPKDVILLFGALFFGPVCGAAATVLSCFIEMLTLSSTGGWGFLMNLIASLTFVMVPLIFWESKKNARRLLLGLLAGSVSMTVLMLLWNYIVTPIYMNVPRTDVVKLLFPVILPFNLIKTGINSGLCLLLYRPLRQGVAAILPEVTAASPEKGKALRRSVLYGVGLFLVITGGLCIYFFRRL